LGDIENRPPGPASNEEKKLTTVSGPHSQRGSIPDKPVTVSEPSAELLRNATSFLRPRRLQIFISYRRPETAWPANWLYQQLAEHYGNSQVFMDVATIEPGDDFVAAITTAVKSCDVLLALIGDRWLTITDSEGQRRIDDPDDFVRLEIKTAFEHNVRVIPMLIDGVTMPRAVDLPTSIAPLAYCQARELSPNRFVLDLDRLFKALDGTRLSPRD
jgi:hypothetical protein